ncbi:Zinc finger, CCHC-type [Plasmopara halstedii]|uniref:Zinc finger, CCHC-type n=1 Tax=Plasmopara halstedii TaxID=4781 RepID=A0A0N7L574_PLAHL|nr:Zinc finger, CCHC-type [Plasmopara halstedii]CEG40683.1 Zinc finger, CCHC-type [Plasmopara halstedii]|eukprot:XP_024577052.1 Zinc finger, CCHC-type [Plasmopara halstedii]
MVLLELQPPQNDKRGRGRPPGAKNLSKSSTKRNPSYFEVVEKEVGQKRRKCGNCGVPGHTRPKCTVKPENSAVHQPLVQRSRPYLPRITDVEADGNCGYRVIALAKHTIWQTVCQTLLACLDKRRLFWDNVFGQMGNG